MSNPGDKDADSNDHPRRPAHSPGTRFSLHPARPRCRRLALCRVPSEGLPPEGVGCPLGFRVGIPASEGLPPQMPAIYSRPGAGGVHCGGYLLVLWVVRPGVEGVTHNWSG